LKRIDHEIRLVAAGSRMAVRAIETEVTGDHAHRAQKVVDSEILECARGDILKKLSGFDVCRWRRHLNLRSRRGKGEAYPKDC
jgi:hypothetical protein